MIFDCMLGNFFIFLLSFADFFFEFFFFSKNFSGMLSECQIVLNLNQDQHSVCPNLGQNCLQRVTAS